MKKTAVEFLIQQIMDDYFIKSKSQLEWQDLFKKAKELEKQQIIKAHQSASEESGFEHAANDWAVDYYKREYED